MPPQPPQQLAHGSIIRNRIRHGNNRLEPKRAILTTQHHRPTIRLIPAVLVLHIIFALGVRFPDVDFNAGDGGAGCGFHGAEDEQGGAVGVGGYAVSRGEVRGVVGVEGAEDGAFCAVGGFGVVEGVDEEGEADYVGEEDEFLGGVRFGWLDGYVYMWVGR